jgi:hypothetical protein
VRHPRGIRKWETQEGFYVGERQDDPIGIAVAQVDVQRMILIGVDRAV